MGDGAMGDGAMGDGAMVGCDGGMRWCDAMV